MMPLRDNKGRFMPAIRHNPDAPFVLLQEDGFPAYCTHVRTEAFYRAHDAGCKLIETRAGQRPRTLLRASRHPVAVL